MKKRAPLPPIELEKGMLEDKSSSHWSSPSNQGRPASRTSGSVKPSGIPVRSPKKSKLLAKSSIRPGSLIGNDNYEAIAGSNLVVNDGYSLEGSYDVGDLSLERTPTMTHVTPPPPQTPNDTPPPTHSTLESWSENSDRLENSLQRNMTPVTASTSPLQGVQVPSQSLLQKMSPPTSPPLQSIQRDAQLEPVSFLSTPPRRLSFSISKVEFQTPSPPKNMPDLPGPPTSSEEGTDSESGRTSLDYLRSDLTAMKTPRPPGAWASTPASSRTNPSEDDFAHGTSNGRPRTPNGRFNANITATKTPRPPGAWTSTPGPPARQQMEDPSLSGDTEPEYDSGLATPVASLSRGSSLPSQTPVPPGAWTATPATRKSILKVRFNAGDNNTVADSIRDPFDDATNAATQVGRRPDLLKSDVPPRTRAQEPASPISPTSRRATLQKSPGIRVLDAFGREVIKDEEKHKASNASRSQSGIRFLDAIGREVESVDEFSQISNGDVSELSVPMNRDEALVRVRQGLADLAEGLDEMNKLEGNGVDYNRLRELQETSVMARVARAEVGAAIVTNKTNINSNLEPLRASMKKSKLFSDHRTHQIVEALRARPSANYGEDIPSNPAALVDWCISRLEAWGTSAGMETFKDDGRQGSISVVLGGKVVVVDVDFSINATALNTPKISVSSVKTSYAITSSDGTTSNSEGSASLDGFIRDSIERFCDEVQKAEEARNPEKAAKLGVAVIEQLKYLVMLDRLAARRDEGGLQWFIGLDKLCPALDDFAKSEAEAVASSLSLSKAPLDIFLLRSHALPLPYFTSPSVSFLVHLSPQAYLALLKTPDTSTSCDISLSTLRTQLFSLTKGLSLATLALTVANTGQIFSATMNMPTFTARPTFPLAPQGSDLEHTFPQTTDPSTDMLVSDDVESGKQYAWILDFTNGGLTPGIVMSQSRMREIELIVNPLGGIDTMDPVTMMSFGAGSWLNPSASVSPERYNALYISPSSVHPPLQLRLRAPEEPGFRLEKIPVHNMKEVWGILEVVREQCWLNEILSGYQWTADGLTNSTNEFFKETEATEEELQAVLDGNLPPTKIPVNVFLPSQNIVTDALFQTPDIDGISIPQLPPRRPRIVMTSPERPPISGMVEITVAYDESKPRGISVDVRGAMSSDIQTDVLEEICRRGGTLGLPGRVWSKAL
ncbi:hypothetical protein H0H87_011660 [Tephrocybe sp. NHM501043]|nr:hypothetical protein H0H87_011660 [Tephrocybe sp. NHM501043]